MPSLEKTIMVREVLKKNEKRPYVFFAQFSKLSVSDLADLRRNLLKTAKCMVVKNTIAKKAFQEMGFDGASNFIQGQTFITSCLEEPQKVSKILVDFTKEREEQFQIKGGLVDGKTVEVSYVKQLAKLPSKQELLTKTVVGMKSPITGFVLTLNAVIRSFAIVLNQVAVKKGQA